jgi:hypothetical protein
MTAAEALDQLGEQPAAGGRCDVDETTGISVVRVFYGRIYVRDARLGLRHVPQSLSVVNSNVSHPAHGR